MRFCEKWVDSAIFVDSTADSAILGRFLSKSQNLNRLPRIYFVNSRNDGLFLRF
ncbi:hypothetical protein [Helicobacter sp. 23-1045]